MFIKALFTVSKYMNNLCLPSDEFIKKDGIYIHAVIPQNPRRVGPGPIFDTKTHTYSSPIVGPQDPHVPHPWSQPTG